MHLGIKGGGGLCVCPILHDWTRTNDLPFRKYRRSMQRRSRLLSAFENISSSAIYASASSSALLSSSSNSSSLRSSLLFSSRPVAIAKLFVTETMVFSDRMGDKITQLPSFRTSEPRITFHAEVWLVRGKDRLITWFPSCVTSVTK